jgi:hypothetical protein
MSGYRARAFTKFPSCNTFISTLLQFPATSKKQSWTSGAKRWLKIYCPDVLFESSPRAARDTVRNYVDERASGNLTKALVFYQEFDLASSRSFLRDAVKCFSFTTGHGISGLLALRCGGFLSARRAARTGLIPDFFLNNCPCCGVDTPESSSHMLLECSAWTYLRQLLLRPLLQQLPMVLSKDSIVALLCGGTAGGDATKAFRSNWAGSADGLPPFYRNVATFLARIFARRAALIWQHSIRSRGPLD